MTRWQRCGLIGLCSLIMLGGGATAWGSAQTSRLRYDTSPTALVLQYTQVHSGLAQNDPTPRLRVYGDGRMLVYFPPYMKRAGTYEAYLTPEELDSLVHALVEQGVMQFDGQRVQRAVEQSRARARMSSDTEVFTTSDPTLTELEVRVWQVDTPASDIPPHALQQRTIVWADVQTAATRHTAVPALQGLAETERMLQQLLSRPDLQPVESGT